MALNIINVSNSRTSQLADLDAKAVLLVNEGAYIYSNLTGNPAYYANGGGANVTVRGTIGGNTGFSAIYLGQNDSSTAGGGNRVLISQSGVIQGYGGVTMHGGGNWITNQGLIQATGASDPNTLSTNEPAGIFALGAGNRIENSGDVSGFYGIYVQGSGTNIVNSGTITANGDNAIDVFGSATIRNTGTINGDVSVGGGVTDLFNSGTILGETSLASGSTILNYGTIAQGCFDTDLVTNFGIILEITTYDGASSVTNETGGVIGAIRFGLFGTDQLAGFCVNDGEIGSVNFDNSDDTFTNTGRVTALVSMSGGNDTFRNSGQVMDAVAMGGGNNSLDNTGRIDGQVSANDGTDTISSQGFVGSIFTGNGADQAFNGSEGIVGTRVWMDSNDAAVDSLINQGTIGIDLTGFGLATIIFGGGADILTNAGTIYGGVDMGADADTVTNSGAIGGYLRLGDGDDIVDSAAGTIGGIVDLGAGADTYVGTAGIDRVIGDTGADTIDLGARDDVYRAINSDGNDDVEAGDGIDTYNASTVTLAVTIDLSAGTTAGTIGTDTLTGFENIVGGTRGDTLTGSDGANRIDGGAGTDTIDGGAGNDRLIGGDGSDSIAGGLGRDVMTGGTPIDAGDADTFVFTSGSSGTTAATRDTITDFRDHRSATAPFARGADTIDLRQIDASSALAGDQAFSFNATQGAAFSGAAGSLVWRQLDGYALISGDTNGDGVADFTIQLNGQHTLFASDFLL